MPHKNEMLLNGIFSVFSVIKCNRGFYRMVVM